MSEIEMVTYHIYGRTSHPQPLEFVEQVSIAKGQKPEPPQGREWVEVIAIPQSAIIQVIPRKEEVAS